jgi:predicted metal-dependent hydrolase
MSLKIDPIDRMATLVLPSRTSQSAGIAFLNENLAWLQVKLAALPPVIAFEPGQVIPLLGKKHQLTANPTARRGVWVDDFMIKVSGPPEFFARRVTDFLKGEARRQINDRAYPLAEKLGVSIRGIRISDPKSRWGSCNSVGRLAFSWRLVMAPEEVLSYVVAHEVAHLKEMNHSPQFWQWVRQLHNDVDSPRHWLKTCGPSLYCYGC